MRITIATLCLALCAGSVSAQTPSGQTSGPAAKHSTGVTVLPPDSKGAVQPQGGTTGPTDTGSGGAPAESPQGQTPPSMQPAPQGSAETIVGPKVNPQ